MRTWFLPDDVAADARPGAGLRCAGAPFPLLNRSHVLRSGEFHEPKPDEHGSLRTRGAHPGRARPPRRFQQGLLNLVANVVKFTDTGHELVRVGLHPGRGPAAPRLIRKAEAPGTRMRIIALTAGAMDFDRDRCREAGMGGCLIKPFRIAELRREREESGGH